MAKRENAGLRRWIREHREDIDNRISAACKNTKEERRGYCNDYERRLWVLNDSGLYFWAKSEGVNI